MSINYYYYLHSPPCKLVLMVIKHLNIDVQYHVIDLTKNQQKTKNFLKMNPAGQVPAIEDDGFFLAECHAIAKYLCEKYGHECELYPKDIKERFQVDQMLNFNIGTLIPALKPYLFKRVFLGVKPSKKVIELFDEKISILNKFIGNRNYVVGNHLTLADLSVYSIEPYIEMMGFPLHNYPNVIRWINQICYDCSYLNEISSSDGIEDFINSIKNNPKIMNLPRRTFKWFFCIPFECKSKRYQSYDEVVTYISSIRPFHNAVDVINAIHLTNSI